MGEENNETPSRLNPMELLEELKMTAKALHKESVILNHEVLRMEEKLKENRSLMDHTLKEFNQSVKNIRIGISPEDVKKLECYKDYFKHYKPVLYVSLFVMLSGWGLGIFGAYWGIKYYREGVRTKQEIRAEVLQEIEKEGNIIVEKNMVMELKEVNNVLRSWEKYNPKDSKSFENYYKGYQEFKKRNRK